MDNLGSSSTTENENDHESVFTESGDESLENETPTDYVHMKRKGAEERVATVIAKARG
jgi:hypothetical protein